MELKFYDGGLAAYESQKLGCKNAFFIRCGGVSDGYTNGLNLAFGRGDDEKTVLTNLSMCGKAKDFDPQSVVSCPQIHSTDIITVDETYKGLGYFKKSDISCDGYITDKEGIVLGVKTADCVPILFSAKRNGKPFAIAAVHAGWRGSTNGIARKAVLMLMENYGASRDEIFVAIGPSASACCYEVGEEVYQNAANNFGESLANKYFTPSMRDKKYMADLKGFNVALINSTSVRYENMDISEMCTICEERLFYSHRRDGEKRGTHLSVISL